MKQAKVPTEQEIKRLLAVVQQGRYAERDRCAVMLSFYAGLRVSEIAGLVFGDVFDEGGKPRDQILLRAEITKGGSARTIVVSERLSRELRRYRTTLSGNVHPTRCLLETHKGTSFTANILCQLFGRLYRKAGIQGASSHSGRRWFISKLAHSGISLKAIMVLAGHRNLATTQRYIEVDGDMLRRAVEVL